VKWFGKDAILSAIDPDQAIAAIGRAFQDHSSGKVQAIATGHLRFDQPPGDVHVKGAHIDGRPLFAVKVASSFYENPHGSEPAVEHRPDGGLRRPYRRSPRGPVR